MENKSITHEEKLLREIVYPILTAIVIITNGLVVWSSGLILKRGHQEKRSTYLFLGNLSLTAIITGGLRVITFWYTPKNTHHVNCKLVAVLSGSAYTANMYSVGLIAIDRYLFITHGMQYERWVYPNRARFLILGTWIIGVLLAIVPFFWSNGFLHTDLNTCLMSSFATDTYALIRVVLNSLPIVLVTISYSVILSKALWKLKQMEPEINENMLGTRGGLRIHVGSVTSMNNTEENGMKAGTSMWSLFSKSASVNTEKKWKAVKVVVLTTSILLFTWVPFLICYSVYTLICDNKEDENPKYCSVYVKTLRPHFFTLAIVHDLLTPIVYVWWHKSFKEFWVKRCKT